MLVAYILWTLLMRNLQKTLIQDREVASYDDRIAALEEQRSALVAKRITLERKVQEVEAKAKGEAGKGQERRLN